MAHTSNEQRRRQRQRYEVKNQAACRMPDERTACLVNGGAAHRRQSTTTPTSGTCGNRPTHRRPHNRKSVTHTCVCACACACVHACMCVCARVCACALWRHQGDVRRSKELRASKERGSVHEKEASNALLMLCIRRLHIQHALQ